MGAEVNMKPESRYILISVLFLLGAVMLAAPLLFQYQGGEKNKEVIEKLKENTEERNEETDSKPEPDLPEDVLGYITIDKIDIEYAIMEGVSGSILSYYIGHMEETAGIGEPGNCVLAGHRGGRNGVFFKHLDRLVPGDMVTVTDRNGDRFEYVVTRLYDTHAYDSSIKTQGESSVLTLLTCTDKGTRRLIVYCEKRQK